MLKNNYFAFLKQVPFIFLIHLHTHTHTHTNIYIYIYIYIYNPYLVISLKLRRIVFFVGKTVLDLKLMSIFSCTRSAVRFDCIANGSEGGNINEST